jgi:hypothetical protein
MVSKLEIVVIEDLTQSTINILKKILNLVQ